MTRIHRLILACALLALAAPPARALRVATWNLLGYDDAAVPLRRPYMLQVLPGLDPDVMVVQELLTAPRRGLVRQPVEGDHARQAVDRRQHHVSCIPTQSALYYDANKLTHQQPERDRHRRPATGTGRAHPAQGLSRQRRGVPHLLHPLQGRQWRGRHVTAHRLVHAHDRVHEPAQHAQRGTCRHEPAAGRRHQLLRFVRDRLHAAHRIAGRQRRAAERQPQHARRVEQPGLRAVPHPVAVRRGHLHRQLRRHGRPLRHAARLVFDERRRRLGPGAGWTAERLRPLWQRRPALQPVHRWRRLQHGGAAGGGHGAAAVVRSRAGHRHVAAAGEARVRERAVIR